MFMFFSCLLVFYVLMKCITVINIRNCVLLIVNSSYFIGLTRSKKTSVMTTPKRPGTQIWQIYPPVLTSSGQAWQLADLPLDLPADLPPITHIYWSGMAS